MNRKILGIITARGGSKRIPKKNIKNFLGKPLLVWSIEVGIKSRVFDRFILTTDDEEIAEVGKRNGIDVPFLRPKNFAQDTSTSFDAIKHAVEWLKKNDNYRADWIILLEPTSPGRQPFHIQEVAKIINEKKDAIDSIVGITEISPHYSPFKALKIQNKNLVSRIDGTFLRDLIHRNQDIVASYFINSAIYAFKTSNLFCKHPSLWGEKTHGYIMDSKYALDIDTPEDWMIAKLKMKNLLL